MVDRLHTFVRAAASATSVADWTTALGRAVHGLTLSGSDDAWRVAQFDRELARIASASNVTRRLIRRIAAEGADDTAPERSARRRRALSARRLDEEASE